MLLFVVHIDVSFLLLSNHQYDLTLVASDSLNENHTKVIIHIKDVNDLPPEFPQNLYERTLNEEMDAPFRIMQVGNLNDLHNVYYFSW